MKKYWIIIFLVMLIFCIFHYWFFPGTIAGGDLDYLWNYDFFTLHPYAWEAQKGNGLGTFFVPFLWVYIVQSIPITILGNVLHLPWELLQRIVFFYPFLILCVLSPMFLYKKLFPENKFYYLAAIVYLGNTYILNIVQGGQMLFALAYALVPITVEMFINCELQIANCKLRKSLMLGLVLALQFLLDIRVGYIVLFILFLYYLVYFFVFRISLRDIGKVLLFLFIIPGTITSLLHAFWLLPLFFYHNNALEQLGAAYTSLQSVQFFSFAKFENAFSLLHPNWPENIFGKVYFMRPEFIGLPILAYMGVLFLKKQNKQEQFYLLFFAFLALIGTFLAKGANEPFGGIYLWLFTHIPGFVMFRDPTKWYLLIALSYAVLIPFSVSVFHQWLNAKCKMQSFLSVSFIIAYLLFLIHPVLLGKSRGTLQLHTVPQEYTSLAKLLSHDKDFSRTLWIPAVSQFTYTSTAHPAISATSLFLTAADATLIKKMPQSSTENVLQEAAIHYVIIPPDTEGTIFVKKITYQQYVTALQKIPWLHEIPGFYKMHVFAVTNYKQHLWSTTNDIALSYTYHNPTHYDFLIHNARKATPIIFSEAYDPYWRLQIEGKSLSLQRYHNYFMSFTLPQNGEIKGELLYSLQRFVDIGVRISVTTLLVTVCILLVFSFFANI